MDTATIQHAVTTLQERGEPPSVRRVHALTGGSFRDVAKLLRAVVPPQTLGGPMPVTTPPTQLDEAQQALKAAQQVLDTAKAKRDACTREQRTIEHNQRQRAGQRGIEMRPQREQARLVELQQAEQELAQAVTRAAAGVTQAQRRLRGLHQQARDLQHQLAAQRGALAPDGHLGRALRQARDRLTTAERAYAAGEDAVQTLEAQLEALGGPTPDARP